MEEAKVATPEEIVEMRRAIPNALQNFPADQLRDWDSDFSAEWVAKQAEASGKKSSESVQDSSQTVEAPDATILPQSQTLDADVAASEGGLLVWMSWRLKCQRQQTRRNRRLRQRRSTESLAV